MMAKQKLSISKSMSAVKSYPGLVKTVRGELRELEFLIRRHTAESYWRVGKFIHEHLLNYQDRARYGNQIFERLAEDVDRDSSTLQKMLRFYRAYPILADRPELTWSHYRVLMSVKDNDLRNKLEHQIAVKDWDSTDLEEYLRKRKRSQILNSASITQTPQLKFTRGRLNIFRLVESGKKSQGLLMDFGFRVHKSIRRGKWPRLTSDDYIKFDPRKPGIFSKTPAAEDELFTYRADILKIIDGDTFWGTIALPFGITIDQKFRLRGIDCPEMDTAKGKAAKNFVASRLKKFAFIGVKTHKDAVDKYDRYLVDVFYLPGETDENKVVREGKYLNQELLDERLALLYK